MNVSLEYCTSHLITGNCSTTIEELIYTFSAVKTEPSVSYKESRYEISLLWKDESGARLRNPINVLSLIVGVPKSTIYGFPLYICRLPMELNSISNCRSIDLSLRISVRLSLSSDIQLNVWYIPLPKHRRQAID